MLSPGNRPLLQAGNVSSPEVVSAADALLRTYNLSALNATASGTESSAASLFRSADSLGSPGVLLLHNTSSRHALPVFLAELDAAEARAKTRSGVNISASVKALPLTQQERAALNTFLKLLASFFILVPFSYLPATYAAFSVRERAVQAKLLQLTSGCSPYAYWLAQLSWEMFNHTAVVLLCMAIFALYQMDVLIGTPDKGLGCFLLLEFYGLAVIPLSFVVSFAFTNHSAAQVAIALANFVTGFCLVLASYIMGATPATAQLNAQLVNLYRIFPAFLLGEGLLALSLADFSFSLGGGGESTGGGGAPAPAAPVGSNATTSAFGAVQSNYTAGAAAASNGFFTDLFGQQQRRSAFEWELLGRPLLLLVAEFALYTAMTFAIEREQRRLARWIAAVRHWAEDRAAPLRRLLGAADKAQRPNTRHVADPEAARGEFHRAKRADGEWVEDPGVAAERARKQRAGRHTGGAAAAVHAPFAAEDSEPDAVEVLGLRKVFGAEGKASQKVAVDDVWLGIPAGERFGLLGSNGE